MSRDHVSGRKNSAILSMMVCRIESRFSDEVSVLATSLKIATSCICRFDLRSGTAASLILTWFLQLETGKAQTFAYYMPAIFPAATMELPGNHLVIPLNYLLMHIIQTA